MPGAAIECPGCRRPMARVSLERKPLGSADVDLCGNCGVIWFDAHESLQLTSRAVLELFAAMQRAGQPAAGPLPGRLPCPRCGIALSPTQDLQRTTRFTYWRCLRGHGRLTPFTQFLREKDFLRPLTDAELARLRSALRVVRCGSCGAPVDIERATVCSYCGSPIVALDPRAIALRSDELASAQRQSPAVDPDRLLEAMIALERERRRDAASGERGTLAVADLVQLGVGALLRLLDRV